MSASQLLEWFAMGTGVIAAIIVSLNLGAKKTGIGFIIFTASSLAWIGVSVIQGELPLGTQNVVLTVINLIGIYRYLIAR